MIDENQRCCPKCGHPLIEKELEHEGMVPYCEICKEYRFPFFSVAISAIVLSPDKKEILLIKQYHKDRYILVAGYLNRGEDSETALLREIKEEIGLEVESYHFNHSHYFKPSNTLMLNYTVVVKNKDIHPDFEIDSYHWFNIDEARKNIVRPSLASEFLDGYLTKEYHFSK